MSYTLLVAIGVVISGIIGGIVSGVVGALAGIATVGLIGLTGHLIKICVIEADKQRG